MANEFSKPVGKKFPAPVPISQLDPSRKEEYAGIEPDIEEPVVPVEQKPVEQAEPEPEQRVPAEEPKIIEEVIKLQHEGVVLRFKNGLLDNVEKTAEFVPQVSDDEKRDFVRSLFSGTPYIRTYRLFGDFEVVFQDRSVKGTEAIYDEINRHSREKKLNIPNESEASLWIRRFQLAEMLQWIKQPDGAYLFNRKEKTFESRLDCVEALLQLRRPLYQAVYDASIEFDNHIDMLAKKANEPDFWKAGGTS